MNNVMLDPHFGEQMRLQEFLSWAELRAQLLQSNVVLLVYHQVAYQSLTMAGEACDDGGKCGVQSGGRP